MELLNEISREALNLHYNSSGFLPDIGLDRHGEIFCHGPSRSLFWLSGILLVGAVVVAVLPWHTRAVVGELKYWIAGILLFGGICDMTPHLRWQAWGQQISIDPRKKPSLSRTVVSIGSSPGSSSSDFSYAGRKFRGIPR